MWAKPLIAIILFYFFALLQNSFFAHFIFLGGSLNPVFILFFLLVFFEDKRNYFYIILYAVTAGFFLDVFSYLNLGTSIILLAALAVFTKKIQSSLKEERDSYPLTHFSSLFLVCFAAYKLFVSLLSFFPFFSPVYLAFGWNFLAEIIYSLFFANITFYIYKKYLKPKDNSRQIRFI
ncbi:MAG: hypothetical protein A2402_00085 [Candidatus Staskawiczbacteria bacterium RIFOXYC1_FULL_37_43]|nr:MAG: hypothetical protein A2205_03140 [Candidatus Staskawiczbacteria bacterium RIFOXYA1_FULL_37_15]OGZ77292.1 MAG: hypothetical protein A2280_01175 [Candidatus Staskawiczbacteria bacterium RIFOXYA12_FULL_37_10]OGZ79998.1 MAG: hypothetical protein A2353_01875 [Candidatus Staskawiczbacteria bacterium RIFOXYB1_FULL_38_37]OGZ81568.1 MAG: hypothetical protein A2325_00085 [Candidatus Staskawiczbacteria bacterium RIFOXYB2_FULL_37_10]OGZ81638.1 MAG: hypothetical protein A2402_00085 [Candidatus Stask